MRPKYKWLAGLLVVFGVPYYWLLIDGSAGSAPARRIDIAELRRLADVIPGPKPDTVYVQMVGWRRLPGTLLVAGGGLKRNLIGINAFLLRGRWGDIAIDSGLGAREAERLGLERFDPASQARVDRALRGARLIVFTHEHPDHLGGLLRLPDFDAVAARALLPLEQGPGGPLAAGLQWPPRSRTVARPFRYEEMAAVAPGVVLLKTPGHTPGSQMIYVRMSDGREYLFAGDTATMARSWQQRRARSRLVSTWIAPENRAAVFGWLKGLHALHRAAPEVFIVAGHDYDYLLQTGPRNRMRVNFPTPVSPTRATIEGGHRPHARLNGEEDRGPRGSGLATGAAG